MRRTLLVLALAPLALLTACGGDDDTGASPAATTASKPGATVDMVLTLFGKPSDVTIKAGEAVTWVNKNDIAHTIVGGTYKVDSGTGLRTEEKDDGSFKLDVAKTGEKVDFTYKTPGKYQFFCTIHAGMNGSVTVQ